MRILFLMSIHLFISMFIFANPNQQLEHANKIYIAGKYDSALVMYQNIVDSGYQSAELYYNLGNTYYKVKQYTKAIIYFERAKLLKPNDEDILYNIEVSKKHVTDKIEILQQFFIYRWMASLQSIFSSNSWAIISIVSFGTCLILLFIYLFSRILILKKISFFSSLVFLIFMGFSFYFARQSAIENLNPGTAIIIAPSVTAKSTPDETGTDLFVIHEGLKVELIDSVGEWHEIKISDGNKGWIKNTDLEKI